MEKIRPDSSEGSVQWDCSDVTLSFFHFLDTRRYLDLAALMAPDGVWLRQGQRLLGPDAVLAALNARSATRTTCHVVSNIRVSLFEQSGARHARVFFYLTAYDDGASPEQTGLHLVAIRDCCDELIETEHGWRILEKSSHRQLPPE
ncbi:nuclear transport factor 2 family protein [Paralcaligenes ureilyticus]|uniref:SnoaL-like protein n=1 Tax=Paralcaligenes ureilyticus TaxID=627131 RepID=A0A4R3MB00_9BURK|nr:nuclear transport factor 2 family protein [Paralcaligenes ureilyticus]TCT09439.1 SnoaL-like protein [Paralcaligenes ureilyticus]